MIEIDGSYGEGGGQVIRTALTLSAITQKPVHITNIRAGRPNPGLQPQHLMCAKAVRNISRGILTAELQGTELTFTPGPIVAGKYEFDIGTAGSVSLVMQTVLPILLFGKKQSEVTIKGGTHVMKSPSSDYVERVFLPALRKFGPEVTMHTHTIGFYPKGGGEITFLCEPTSLNGQTFFEKDSHVQVLIRSSGLPPLVGIREKKIFVQNKIEHVNNYDDPALSIGNAITAWKGFNGSYVLGEKGKPSEKVAQECLDFLNAQDSEVDLHLADQLLPYAALGKGETRFTTSEITEHFKTNVWVIQKFLDRKIEIKGKEIIVT